MELRSCQGKLLSLIPHRRGPFMANPQHAERTDQALIASLSEEFRSALRHYFLRRRLPAQEVEDATQEVFMRLSRRRGLADMENVAGYLFETAASVAIDQQRRAQVRRSDAHDAYDDQFHAIPDMAPDQVLQGRQELRLVLAGLLELPERTRHIFVLARLEHMRHAEIACRLGISVSAVEKHVVKALAHLAARAGRSS